MQDVNLLPDIERQSSLKSKRAHLLSLGSTLLLIICVTAIAVVTIFYFMSVKNLTALKQERTPIETQINALKKREYIDRALVAKTDQISKIMASQPPFRQIVGKLLELNLSGITFSELSLNPPNKVILSGHAANIAVLDTFLGDLTAKEFGRLTFSDIVLQSLARADNGEYDFSLRFNYSGK